MSNRMASSRNGQSAKRMMNDEWWWWWWWWWWVSLRQWIFIRYTRDRIDSHSHSDELLPGTGRRHLPKLLPRSRQSPIFTFTKYQADIGLEYESSKGAGQYTTLNDIFLSSRSSISSNAVYIYSCPFTGWCIFSGHLDLWSIDLDMTSQVTFWYWEVRNLWPDYNFL